MLHPKQPLRSGATTKAGREKKDVGRGWWLWERKLLGFNINLSQLMTKEIIYIAATILAFCPPASSAEIIAADCNNEIQAVLSISDKQVSITGSPSGFNLESIMQVNGIPKAGYTAIFYGGQSKFFYSYDGSISFESTIGHGGQRKLSTVELQTRSGRYSCIVK